MHTLQLHGLVKKQKVLMLVDSGSTSNFIDLALAKSLGLELVPIKTLQVVVADGFTLPVQFMCQKVCWSAQGAKFCTDLLAMPIGGFGIILGIQWMSTLGDICCNFKQLTIKFLWEGRQVSLYGTPRQQLLQPHEIIPQVFDLQLKGNETTTLSSDQRAELEQLLTTFEDVFTEPTSLPRKRSCDHSITLQQGSDPVNLKAYKYAPFQKDN